MPYKHQMDSYRTKDGVRYLNEGDILDESKGDLRVQAQAVAKQLRASGRKAFIEKQDGDWFRVYGEVAGRSNRNTLGK